jgi:hypothetical protein
MKKYLLILLLLLPIKLSAQITYNVPEVLYLKFNNGSVATPNYANPGAGCQTAGIHGMTLGNGGMFDSALIGQNLNSDISFVENKWATWLPSSGWSIGFWINNLALPPNPTNPVYLFGEGDPGADNFRCYWAGNGIGTSDTAVMFRKGTQLNVRIPVPTNAASYIHFVYDPSASAVRGYRNGQLIVTSPVTSMTVVGNGPFKVAGHLTFPSLSAGMKMDEFRIYNRVLSSTEIAATWNQTLPYTVTGIVVVSNEIPDEFKLFQNYPNPFNPKTTIRFNIDERSQFSDVSLVIYNSLGQIVKSFVNESAGSGLNAGVYEVQFEGTDLSSGVYYYKLTAGEFSDTKKMILIK